ncbi:GNAT family N-acetyltransferase [Schaalia sp. Marseille-Q2122]|uniref:GNAT family N-acetyltransferase n=1 Tax=Schaalia sp. Marseille-Q2122 TaxID=2736604 RepID=UPI00158EC076|nr:GNAT family N-acetyltransferase [Schaalia sp. Marseille-Q2122]
MDTLFRCASGQDRSLLAEAVLGNINWCGPRFSAADVTDQPDFARYAALVEERGDFGVVALGEGGEAVGVVWAQYLGAENPGYGYVDEATPELSLWVRDGYRSQGIGRALMRVMKAEALRRGVRRISLSVEEGNYARMLYEDEGFVAVAGREAEGVMLWEAGSN